MSHAQVIQLDRKGSLLVAGIILSFLLLYFEFPLLDKQPDRYLSLELTDVQSASEFKLFIYFTVVLINKGIWPIKLYNTRSGTIELYNARLGINRQLAETAGLFDKEILILPLTRYSIKCYLTYADPFAAAYYSAKSGGSLEIDSFSIYVSGTIQMLGSPSDFWIQQSAMVPAYKG